jgi:elongation factor 1-gamma
LRHVARINKNAGLLGSNDVEQTLVDQWLEFDTSELEPAVLVLVKPILGWQAPLVPEILDKANADLQTTLSIVDKHLLLNTFLVGTQVTIADISLAATLIPAYQFYFEAHQRETFPNVLRWLNTLLHLSPFKKVMTAIFLYCLKTRKRIKKKFCS